MKGRPLPPLPHLSATGSPAWQLLPQHWKYWSFAILGVPGESEIQTFQHRIFSLISRPNPLRASLLSPICSDTEAGTMADKPFPLGGAQPHQPRADPSKAHPLHHLSCCDLCFITGRGGMQPRELQPWEVGSSGFPASPREPGGTKVLLATMAPSGKAQRPCRRQKKVLVRAFWSFPTDEDPRVSRADWGTWAENNDHTLKTNRWPWAASFGQMFIQAQKANNTLRTALPDRPRPGPPAARQGRQKIT